MPIRFKVSNPNPLTKMETWLDYRVIHNNEKNMVSASKSGLRFTDGFCKWIRVLGLCG
jgi:hypothetical protein